MRHEDAFCGTMGGYVSKHILREKQAFIFDFDGTLAILSIDFGHMRRQVSQIIASYGVAPSQFDHLYILEMIDAAVAQLNRGDADQGARFYRQAQASIGALEVASAATSGMLPGAIETLQFLRGRGCKIGVVTRNSAAAVRTICATIDQLSDVFLPREAVRFAKPHPEHLQRALEQLQVPAHDAVIVGDGPIDISAGKALGLMTVAVLSGGNRREALLASQPDIILASVADITTSLLQGDLTTP
jgi:phosphoglycolate phosphatase